MEACVREEMLFICNSMVDNFRWNALKQAEMARYRSEIEYYRSIEAGNGGWMLGGALGMTNCLNMTACNLWADGDFASLDAGSCHAETNYSDAASGVTTVDVSIGFLRGVFSHDEGVLWEVRPKYGGREIVICLTTPGSDLRDPS